MRCRACDKVLTDFESSRKYAGTSNYLDLCNSCFKPISDDVQVEANYSLIRASDFDDDDEYEVGDIE